MAGRGQPSPPAAERSTLPAVAAIWRSRSRSGGRPRDQLARLDPTTLTQALPRWVGSLTDIDDLLPASRVLRPRDPGRGLSIDQPLAAPALLRRGGRSSSATPGSCATCPSCRDERLADATRPRPPDEPASSAASTSAGTACSTWPRRLAVLTLDEHFRSDSAPRRLRRPPPVRRRREGRHHARAPSRDCVESCDSQGPRTGGRGRGRGRWVIRRLRALLDAGVSSVGVITPFRAQARARARRARRFSHRRPRALDLRMGTVHAFQGNERDIVIVSLGVGPDQGRPPGASSRIPTSSTCSPPGPASRYLLLSSEPPPGGSSPTTSQQADPHRPPFAPGPATWATEIADDLRGRRCPDVASTHRPPPGRPVRADARAGRRHRVRRAPDGPDAHVDRHLALRRAGWTSSRPTRPAGPTARRAPRRVARPTRCLRDSVDAFVVRSTRTMLWSV